MSKTRCHFLLNLGIQTNVKIIKIHANLQAICVKQNCFLCKFLGKITSSQVFFSTSNFCYYLTQPKEYGNNY